MTTAINHEGLRECPDEKSSIMVNKKKLTLAGLTISFSPRRERVQRGRKEAAETAEGPGTNFSVQCAMQRAAGNGEGWLNCLIGLFPMPLCPCVQVTSLERGRERIQCSVVELSQLESSTSNVKSHMVCIVCYRVIALLQSKGER